MKEITTYGDQYGRLYEVKGTDGYYKTFRNYQDATEYYKEYYSKYNYAIDPWEESEEDRIAREAREKAIRRNKRIDSILD
jgi:hypothetical protein